MSAVNTGYLSNKEEFFSLIIERLGRCSIDYSEKIRLIPKTRETEDTHSAAGVLLLLHFKNSDTEQINNKGEFIFQLIKRSPEVTQPGDLSCPGGLLHNFWDRMLQPLITSRLFTIMRGNALKYAEMRDNVTFRLITLFLANAVREAWEETGLRPWNILFLGPLPTYSLHLFKRTIFPLVCFVRKEWHFYPNPEVDSIVEIPLMTFFDENNYGLYNIEPSDHTRTSRKGPSQFPCLIINDNQGNEEILWGATFYIVMNFLKIVLNFEIPDLHSKRIIKRTLEPEYLTGYQRRH